MNTAIGDISKDNARYLIDQGVLTVNEEKELEIAHQLIDDSSFNRPLQLWSLFCHVVQDIRDTYNSRMDIDAVIGIMRNGSLKTDVQYASVTSVRVKGKNLALSGASEKRRVTF